MTRRHPREGGGPDSTFVGQARFALDTFYLDSLEFINEEQHLKKMENEPAYVVCYNNIENYTNPFGGPLLTQRSKKSAGL